MRQFGNWVIPGAAPRFGPGVVGVAPTQAAGTTVTFTATASHTLGLQQIGLVHMLISDRLVGGAAYHVVYFAFDDIVALINDSGTDLAAPGRVARSSANTLSNSRCSLNVAGMARTAGVNDVSVTYPLTFVPATYMGQKGVYLNTFDLSGNLSHWVQAGTSSVQ